MTEITGTKAKVASRQRARRRRPAWIGQPPGQLVGDVESAALKPAPMALNRVETADGLLF